MYTIIPKILVHNYTYEKPIYVELEGPRIGARGFNLQPIKGYQFDSPAYYTMTPTDHLGSAHVKLALTFAFGAFLGSYATWIPKRRKAIGRAGSNETSPPGGDAGDETPSQADGSVSKGGRPVALPGKPTDPSHRTKAPASPEDGRDSVGSGRPVKLVLQRFREISLLSHDGNAVTAGRSESPFSYLVDPPAAGTGASAGGLLVYVSMGSSTSESDVVRAAKTVMNASLLTRGSWGDGSNVESVLDTACSDGGVAVVLVPQANLISKVLPFL
mmetsp:Transcript_9309/g.20574  ORF Transcript_9309/g.20574 Transcript_9309/m.20574 type:complete len:272 (-) Transcript_9309:618-1433(-)